MTKETITFSPRELDVLKILVNSSEPMTYTDIVNSSHNSLKQPTVLVVLRKLLKNRYVEVAGITHSANVLSRTYVATKLAHNDIIKYYATLYQPFISVLGLSPLIKLIVSSLDEDTKKKLLTEVKEL